MSRITFLLALLLLLPAPARPADSSIPSDPSARLLNLGWTTQDGAIKIVAHLDRPVRYRATTAAGRVIVDLWPVAAPAPQEIAVNTGGVVTVRQIPVDREIARLSVGVNGATRYKVYTRIDPYKVAVVILPSWRAMVPLPSSVAYAARRVRTGRGWTDAHVVQVDLADPQIAIRPALGGGAIPGQEPTGAAATRHDALVAINGGFFTVRTGTPLGMVMIDGKLLSTPIGRRAVFAITAEGRPLIQAFAFRGTVETDTGQRIPVSAVNRPPRWGGVAVYTPEYGPLTPPHRIQAVIRGGTVVALPNGRVAIPADGYVLAAAVGQTHLIQDRLVRGQRVRLNLAISPSRIVHALGGGPRLVQNGAISIPFRWEQFGPSFNSRRTSRSAVGITAAGKVLLVTVERAPPRSAGMNLAELAQLLRDLGAVDAMNLDGGSSATLVVGGRVVNRAESAQRGVASMLLVVRRPTD